MRVGDHVLPADIDPDGAHTAYRATDITDEMKLPVRYVGIGEKVQDLREFEPAGFADALFAEA